jgi:hypothetical protein
MRAVIFGSVLVFAASAASARTDFFPAPNGPDATGTHLTLPSQDDMAASFRIHSTHNPAYSPAAETAPSNGIVFGLEGTTRAGDPRHVRHVLQYRLEGVSIMGGSVGGSLNGRGGVLQLQWPVGH